MTLTCSGIVNNRGSLDNTLRNAGVSDCPGMCGRKMYPLSGIIYGELKPALLKSDACRDTITGLQGLIQWYRRRGKHLPPHKIRGNPSIAAAHRAELSQQAPVRCIAGDAHPDCRKSNRAGSTVRFWHRPLPGDF